MKSFERKLGVIFKQNVDDPTKTDLFRTTMLEYSQFESDLLDQYIRLNFNDLYNQGADNFYLSSSVNGYIYTYLPDVLIQTFDVTMPAVKNKVNDKGMSNIDYVMLGESKNLDDYDVGIKYTRYFTAKNLKKSQEGYNVIENEYDIRFDVCTFQEMEDSVIEHHKSYLLLGAVALTYTNYSYYSNKITKNVIIG